MNRIMFAMGEAHVSGAAGNVMPTPIAKHPLLDHHHDAGAVWFVDAEVALMVTLITMCFFIQCWKAGMFVIDHKYAV
jgi:hypothetical protein